MWSLLSIVCLISLAVLHFWLKAIQISTSLSRVHSFTPPSKSNTSIPSLKSLLFPTITAPISGQTHSSDLWQGRGFLSGLAPRQPNLVGSPKLSTAQIYTHLSQSIFALNTSRREQTYLGRSTYETGASHSTTLYSRHHIYPDTTYHGLICRVNPTDNKVHVTLHPADADTVTIAGWASPTSHDTKLNYLTNWLKTQDSHERKIVIRAPRTEEEVQTVIHIVETSAWWVGGVDSRQKEESWT